MDRFILPQDSESQVSYSSSTEREVKVNSTRGGSEVFPKWSFESGVLDTDSPEYSSSWRWFAPSLWASQWPNKSPAHLESRQQSIWMSACPLCSSEGPEWTRVVQEPPHMILIQQSDLFCGRRFIQPLLPTRSLVDWDDPWGHRQAYNRSRFGKGTHSRRRAFAQDQELLAASVGNLEWLQYCLKNQKEIHSDRRGFTALHLAAERGNLECVMALVDQYKFPVEMTTNKGWTPLHLAVNKENPAVSLKCIQYLIEKGASVNVRNRNGITPLHLASGEGMLDCIKVLVKAGADVHALDNQNLKSIDLCKAWNHRDCARFLKDAMWKQDKKDLAEEMGQLSQLKKRLLVMQNKYHLEKKKEKEVQNQVAFTKWLQTKPLPKLPKVKRSEPALVTKEPAQVTKKSARVTKAPRVKKEPPPVTKEAPHVKKEAPQVKKKGPQVTKPQSPRRPHPPPKPRPTLTPPARRRFRPLKRPKPSNPRTPLTILPSLSPLIPSHPSQSIPASRPSPRSHSGPGSRSSPSSPRSSSHFPRSPSPPSTVRSRRSILLRSFGAASSSSRPASGLYLSPSFPPSPRYYSRFSLRQSCPLLHPPPELVLSELKLPDRQKRRSYTPGARPPEQPLSLLDMYLADIPLTPPPARPSSPSYWTAKWNSSTKPEARPVTQIAFPQSVRLGVHPDPVREPDFCDFLKFSPDGEGGVHIQTADGQWIFPVPRVPFKVLLRELCPSRQHQRLKVPEGLRPLAVQDLPRRRYPGDQSFWTDSMAMSLRDTFDPAFISLVRKHQGLPPTSPRSSSSSPSSTIAFRQCWALLFYSLDDPPLIK